MHGKLKGSMFALPAVGPSLIPPHRQLQGSWGLGKGSTLSPLWRPAASQRTLQPGEVAP